MNGFGSMKEWIRERLKTRSKTDGIVLILIGVLVLVVLMPTGGGTRDKSKATQDQDAQAGANILEESISNEDPLQTDSEYISRMEEQVQKLLESMDGAGKVQVMLTLSDDGMTYLDKDVKTQKEMREETTVVYDTGDAKTPYVIRRERPKVEGVVVVAQGGDRPGVITQITDAMQSLFGLEAHKVKVVKMSVQEE